VDGPLLGEVVDAIDRIATDMPVVFPIHPRTRKQMEVAGLAFTSPNVRLLEPLGYLEFLSLIEEAAGVLTDSGGIQEETTYLSIPCFTLRDNTERPVTVDIGTNVLLGLDPTRVLEVPAMIEAARERPTQVPPGWDGAAAERLVDVIEAGIPGWDAELTRTG
jgi:UDP-N-acetylglucosamine 2-epimerase (non-hydrolysing)